MLRGRPEELKSEANFLTDDNELRSNSMASTLALEIAFTICSLASLPAAMFLTAITTWAPRSARTRAVSVPIPLDAPATSIPLVLHIDVAGPSSGIGTETARVLALRGAHVVMAVRNMAAGKDAREQIVKALSSAKVDAMELDLSSLSSVRKFASDLSSLSSVGKVDAYFQSKIANILHANELARRLKEEGADITANSLHPGAIVTNLFRYNNAVNGFVKVLGRAVFKNVKQGAATTCYVALHPQVEGVTGEYFWDSNLSKPCRQGQDAEMAKKLWDFSMDLTK